MHAAATISDRVDSIVGQHLPSVGTDGHSCHPRLLFPTIEANTQARLRVFAENVLTGIKMRVLSAEIGRRTNQRMGYNSDRT
jgi:hypothetical protein